MLTSPAQYFKTKGFTIFELLITMALLGVVSGFVLITFQTTRGNQALRASSGELADRLREAHIFARESKDKKAWGIRSGEASKYALIAKDGSTWTDVQNYSLESGVLFENSFSVEFARDSGEANSETNIVLVNKKGKKITVQISKTGVVEAGSMQ